MSLGIDLAELCLQLAIAIDDEGGPLDLDDGLAVHGAVAHYVELLGYEKLRVGEERVWQRELLCEFLLLAWRVAGDAEQGGARGFELRIDIPKLAGFNGAARGIGARVEEEDYGLAAELRERNGVSVLIRKGEVDGIADLHEYKLTMGVHVWLIFNVQ